jgi:hypothetical protein
VAFSLRAGWPGQAQGQCSFREMESSPAMASRFEKHFVAKGRNQLEFTLFPDGTLFTIGEISNQNKKEIMKPTFLMFFFLMVVSATVFAGLYVYFQPLVEKNALAFSVGLVVIMVVGMFGMMHSIINGTTIEEKKIY